MNKAYGRRCVKLGRGRCGVGVVVLVVYLDGYRSFNGLLLSRTYLLYIPYVDND